MSVNMKRFSREDADAVRADLTPAMVIAVGRSLDNDPEVSPATRNALERRGLIKHGRRGEWRWTPLARMVRRGTPGSRRAEADRVRRAKKEREAKRERPLPRGNKRKLKP